MKRYIITSFILLIFTYSSYSQIVTVLDSNSNKGVPLVNIVSEEPRDFAITNNKGQADISSLKGSEKIEFRSVGFKIKALSYKEIEDKDFKIYLVESNITLNQVVISANKWDQESRDIPAKISIISAKEALLENPQTAADLLGSFGDVYIQKSQQGGGSPMIRGFATNRLLYTIDEVRMNNAIFRFGNLQNVISLDPFAIENTEILYGPGSVIYGSDAIGGVMNFQTLKHAFATDEEALIFGKAITRYSSVNNEKTAHFNLNIALKKWSFISSYTATEYGDLRMGTNGPDDYLRNFYVKSVNDSDYVVKNDDPYLQNPSGYKQNNFMQKVAFKASDKWLFNYGFHYSATGNYDRYDRLIRTKNGLPRAAEWYYGPQIWMMNNFMVKHSKSNSLYDNAELRIAQQYFEESRYDRDFNDDNKRARIEKIDAYSLNLDFEKILKKKSKLYYGAEYVQNIVNSSAYIRNIVSDEKSATASRYPDADWHSAAIYFSLNTRLSDKLRLQTGGRYNHFIINTDFSDNIDFYPLPEQTSQLNKGALSGNAGIVFNPNKTTTLSANLSTGFRAPNVDDIGKVFDSEPGSVVVPNTNLEAEYAYNADVSIAKIFADKLKAELTAFYTYLDNALVRRDFTLDGKDSIMYDGEMSKVQAIQNAASANVYGLQLGLEWKLPANFSFSGKINYQKGKEEMDDGSLSPSRHAAPLFGIAKIKYKYKKFRGQFYAVYNDEVSYEELNIGERDKEYLYALDDDGNPYSPAWYTLNIKASYDVNKNLSFNFGMENITDQLYRPYSSGLAAGGRNFVFSLVGRF